jgi:hypothetical protein
MEQNLFFFGRFSPGLSYPPDLRTLFHTIEVQAARGKPNPKGLNRESISRKVTR